MSIKSGCFSQALAPRGESPTPGVSCNLDGRRASLFSEQVFGERRRHSREPRRRAHLEDAAASRVATPCSTVQTRDLQPPLVSSLSATVDTGKDPFCPPLASHGARAHRPIRSHHRTHRSDPDESRHDVADPRPLLAHLPRAGPLHPLGSAQLLHPLRRGPSRHRLHSLCAEASFCSVALHGLKCVCLRQTLDGPRRSFSPPSWHSPAWSSSACPLFAC